MDYKPTIGLEIHAELKTKTKMFCDSLNDPLEKHPNINICPICVSHPGTLPVINKEAIKKTILAGRALKCKIADRTFFERKNYFYPDLPKGYQISQYQKPLCTQGYLELSNREKIRIIRIHIEEDTGKLLHSPDGKESYVDFNRAGVPLMELVTEPDLENGDQVREFAQELQLIFRYLGVSDADMEKGQMRVEVNISVAKDGELGTKVEIKNLNSIKAAANSVNYEIKRQSQLLEQGKKIIQETRGWDENKKSTFSQRTKEEAQDYRYFPEPDLPPLKIEGDTELSELPLPELPDQRRKRFKEQYGLNNTQIEIFTVSKDLGDYYEKVASEIDQWARIEHSKKEDTGLEKEKTIPGKLHSLAANYIITEFPPLIQGEIKDIKVSPSAFSELMVKIFHKELSSTGVKAVLKEIFETGLSPSQIIEHRGMTQVSSPEELLVAIEKVITQNPKAFEDLKKGKRESLKFLVGKVMAETKGRANPQLTAELIEKRVKKL